jgi:hypothetical protein
VGAFDLAAQYRDLVAEQQDLDRLGGVAAGQQDEGVKELSDDQVDER